MRRDSRGSASGHRPSVRIGPLLIPAERGAGEAVAALIYRWMPPKLPPDQLARGGSQRDENGVRPARLIDRPGAWELRQQHVRGRRRGIGDEGASQGTGRQKTYRTVNQRAERLFAPRDTSLFPRLSLER